MPRGGAARWRRLCPVHDEHAARSRVARVFARAGGATTDEEQRQDGGAVIWLNPWALIGLAGVALPVLIHLLARGHARRHRFPSLRFIDPSQLLPTRRTRVQDPLLLALRCGIVGLTALALAQPVLLTARRKQA